MEKIVGLVISTLLIIGMAAGSRSVLKQTFLMIQKASLAKAAEGLPPLTTFAAALTGQKKSNRIHPQRLHRDQK